MAKLVGKMLSRIIYFFLYFVTCCGLEACRTLSRARRENDQEVQGDIKLDPIANPEEEHSHRASCSRSFGKCNRGINYDVTMDYRTMVARRCCWFRRNRIVPAFLPVVGGGVADLYTVNTQDSWQQDEALVDKPVESPNEDIVLGFSETKDSFSVRKNSALALQSFATCARLNENFMRKTAWASAEADNGNGEGCSSGSQGTAPSTPSFSSKVSFAWNSFRGCVRISDVRAGVVGVHSESASEAGTSKGKRRTAPDRKAKKDEGSFKRKKRDVKKLFRSGKLKKSTSTKPVAIQKLGENDLTTFDRDLYMRINKLIVSRDTCQSSSHDPFFVQDDVPPLSEVPIAYLTINSRAEGGVDSSEGKSRLKSFFERFKREKT